jgi:muconolactone delta-isomerase
MGEPMEFLVSMTTHVPEGTAEQEVDEVRAREAARSAELATQRHLLRLWRPPLRPGEWRTFGLFAAEDAGQLEKVLASMPLRVWRTDEVTPLAEHPFDPPAAAAGRGTEFLVWFTLTIPDGTPDQVAADTTAAEGRRVTELAGQGHLERVWWLPGGRTLGLYRAADPAALEAILRSLPLYPWMNAQVTPLSKHPSDPGVNRP